MQYFWSIVCVIRNWHRIPVLDVIEFKEWKKNNKSYWEKNENQYLFIICSFTSKKTGTYKVASIW